MTDLLERVDHAADGVGYLDARDYSRFVWAWEKAPRLASWLYSAGKLNSVAETDIRVDSSSAPGTPLESTWLAADEITSHLHALNRFPDETAAAMDIEGHRHAAELGKCVSIADRRWPMEERPHPIRHMRCGGCEKLTLTYRPPRFQYDTVIVDCMCGYRLTEDEWSWATLMVEAELAGESTVGGDDESA